MNLIDTSILEAALEKNKPTKKMSLIRLLMPKINLAIRRGLSKKEIWESLNRAGLEMNYKMFVTYLSRIEVANEPIQALQDASREVSASDDRGPQSTQEALSQARQNAARKDYSKIVRNRTTRTKK